MNAIERVSTIHGFGEVKGFCRSEEAMIVNIATSFGKDLFVVLSAFLKQDQGKAFAESLIALSQNQPVDISYVAEIVELKEDPRKSEDKKGASSKVLAFDVVLKEFSVEPRAKLWK